MSRAARAAACLVLVLGAHPRPASADGPPTPPLEAVDPRYDAGRVEAGTIVRHTYLLRNHGTATLQILAKPSCGCTTTDYDRTIASGTTGTVAVAVDTKSMRGSIEKTIAVITNDPAQATITLTLVAAIRRPLIVEPTDQPLLRGPARQVPAAVLTVRAPDGGAFRILRVADEPSLRAAIVPLDAAVGGKHRRYQVTLTPSPDLPVGSYHPGVTLITSLTNVARFALEPTIVVTGPLLVLPWQLHVDPGVATVAVRVTASDGAAFHVLAAECSDPDFTAAFTPVADAPAWDVVLRFAGSPTRHGPVSAMLKITTDVPAQPLVLVRLAGRL